MATLYFNASADRAVNGWTIRFGWQDDATILIVSIENPICAVLDDMAAKENEDKTAKELKAEKERSSRLSDQINDLKKQLAAKNEVAVAA